MSIQKFRDVADMPPIEPVPPGPELVQRLRDVWGTWARLTPPLDFRGVRKYRTLEEADRDRDDAVRRRARAMADSRRDRQSD